MTRAGYVELAKKYSSVISRANSKQEEDVWLEMVYVTAQVLAQDNVEFNRELFWQACGVGEIEIGYMLCDNLAEITQ